MQPESKIPREPDDLLLKWHNRFRKSERAHYKSANSCRIFNYALGIPLVIITTIIANEYFSKIEAACRKEFESSPEELNLNALGYLVIALTMLAPVLAALQTFLRFPERAEQHRKAAVTFGLLKKDVEKLLTFPPSDPETIETVINDIQEKDLQVMREAPSIGAISLWWVNYRLKPETKGGLLSRLSARQQEKTDSPDR